MTIRSTYVIVCVLRCKEIQDREKRGRVDQGAAKRMITSGLWKPGDEKIRERGNALSRPPLTFYALDDFPVFRSRNRFKGPTPAPA